MGNRARNGETAAVFHLATGRVGGGGRVDVGFVRGGRGGVRQGGHMTDHAGTMKNSGHASTRQKRGCHADTGTKVVTKTRRVRSCRRRGAGREGGRGGNRRKTGGWGGERGRWQGGRGETGRRRNEGTGSAARRGQPGEVPSPGLRRPRRGQQRGVRVGHWAKGGHRLVQDRCFCQIQVQ